MLLYRVVRYVVLAIAVACRGYCLAKHPLQSVLPGKTGFAGVQSPLVVLPSIASRKSLNHSSHQESLSGLQACLSMLEHPCFMFLFMYPTSFSSHLN